MKVIGVTGGICCGKGLVMDMIAQKHNVKCLNTDKMAKIIIFNPENTSKVASLVGLECLTSPAGYVDKKKLTNIIFDPKNKDKKKDLEDWCHAIIWDRIKDIKDNYKKDFIFVESALIFETNSQDKFDEIITVFREEGEQEKYMKMKRGYSDEKIQKIKSTQIDQHKKMRGSDVIVLNNGDLDHLRSEVNLKISKRYFVAAQ